MVLYQRLSNRPSTAPRRPPSSPAGEGAETALRLDRRPRFCAGALPLDVLTATHRLRRCEEAFELIEQASFARMFDKAGPPPSGMHSAERPSGRAEVIFQETNTAMVADHRFVRFCAKLGLCDYWVATDRWPDCAEDGSLPYDFKAEIRRLAAAR